MVCIACCDRLAKFDDELDEETLSGSMGYIIAKEGVALVILLVFN